MPPRKRSTATENPDAYEPGDHLVLDDAAPMVFIGFMAGRVAVRAGEHHSAPILLPNEGLRKATEDESLDFEDFYARQTRVARSNGELE